MKKIQILFAAGACLVAAASVSAKKGPMAVTTFKYFRASTPAGSGALCNVTISTPTCATGTQCKRKFTVSGTESLYALSFIKTVNGEDQPCAILPGDVQQ